jgi:sulfoxide reductase heme-binding subunit YedZ
VSGKSRGQFPRWVAKPMVFLLSAAPGVLLAWNFYAGNLSFNPIEDITHTTGRWALRFTLVTLAVTPVRQLTRFKGVIRYRRMLGLWAFFYASCHFMIYLGLDHLFDLTTALANVPEQPFITAGFTAFVLMIPLAVTSTTNWIRRLGGRRWRNLHRLIYVSAVAGVIHYLWIGKVVEPEPVAYVVGLCALLGFRLLGRFRPEALARLTGH